jgi:hypothetical protein
MELAPVEGDPPESETAAKDDSDVCLFTLHVHTDTSLAAVLNVTRPAIAKAAHEGRITREDDGTWEVFSVLHEWRANTWDALRRDAGRWRPWFDTRVSLDSNAVMSALIARTRHAGGTVTAQYRRNRAWEAVPDPVLLLRTGTQLDAVDPTRARPPITEAVLCELDGLVPFGSTWLEHIEVLADAVAEECGVPQERVYRVLEEQVRIHLAFLAQCERETVSPVS